jgi:hypothetical protein
LLVNFFLTHHVARCLNCPRLTLTRRSLCLFVKKMLIFLLRAEVVGN